MYESNLQSNFTLDVPKKNGHGTTRSTFQNDMSYYNLAFRKLTHDPN